MADSSRSNLRKLKDEYARNPGSRVFVHLAEAYRKAGELRQAHQVLADGLKRHVDYPSGMVVLAKVLTDQGEAERAAAVWRDVVRLDPENVVALRALGDLAESAGRRDEAMQYYRRIVRLENGEPDADDSPFGAPDLDDTDDEPAPFAAAPARGDDAPERGARAPEPQPALAKSRFSWLVRSVARTPAAEPQPARAAYDFGTPAPAARAEAPAQPSADAAAAPARVEPALNEAPAAARPPSAPVQPTRAPAEPTYAEAPAAPAPSEPAVADTPASTEQFAPSAAPEPIVADAPVEQFAPSAAAPIAEPAVEQVAQPVVADVPAPAEQFEAPTAEQVAAEPVAEPVHPNLTEEPVFPEAAAPEEVEERAFSEIAAVEDEPEFADAPRVDAAPESAAEEDDFPAEPVASNPAFSDAEPAVVEEDDFPARSYDQAPSAAQAEREPFIDVDPEDPDGPYIDVRTEVPEQPIDDAELDESEHAVAVDDDTVFASAGQDAAPESVTSDAPPAEPDTFEGIFGVQRGTLLEDADGEVVVLGTGSTDAEPAEDAEAPAPDDDDARAEEVESQEEIVATVPEVEEEDFDEPQAAPVSFEELAQLAYDSDTRVPEPEEAADPLAQIRAELYGVDAEGAGETMPGVAAALAEVLVRMLEREGSVMHAESSLRRLLAAALARELGLNEAEQEALSLAATLGAIGELREQDAGDTGRNQAVTIQLLSGVALPEAARQALAHQYERWDGAGLPSGLREEQIPFPARVLAVARGAAALLGRNQTGAAAVVDALQRHAGTAFDPLVVSVLRRVFAQRERHGIGYGWGGRVAVAHPHELRGLEIAAQLHAEGYEAETAQSASALREHLSGGTAEALIVGADLPDADVAALVRELRGQTPTLPVLVVDAADARRRVELLGAGADVCFPAGAEFLEVRATLDALLRRGETPG